MRAFVAVVPPASALAALVDVVTPLRETHPGATWIPPERLHLTLAFLGDVADDVAARVGVALAEAVRETAPFALRLRGGGAFPRVSRPSVLWSGVDGDVDALGSLARTVRRTARGAGVTIERAPYVPHVTVARVRRRDVDGRAAVAALDAVTGEQWTVTEVVLMRSHLGPQPEYRVLRCCPLSTS